MRGGSFAERLEVMKGRPGTDPQSTYATIKLQ
jgi:hypothetical protein